MQDLPLHDPGFSGKPHFFSDIVLQTLVSSYVFFFPTIFFVKPWFLFSSRNQVTLEHGELSHFSFAAGEMEPWSGCSCPFPKRTHFPLQFQSFQFATSCNHLSISQGQEWPLGLKGFVWPKHDGSWNSESSQARFYPGSIGSILMLMILQAFGWRDTPPLSSS